MATEREVSCPCCKAPCLYAPSNPHRPFCSARCKQVDFGAWATERYAVEAKPPVDPDAEPETGASLAPSPLN